MASSNYVECECPQCHTKVGVRITYGIYPAKTVEIANCPVCWKELFKKNITGDIEEVVISLDNTIEPYLSEFNNKAK
jgi:hypothetical protein